MEFLQSASKFVKHVLNISVVSFLLQWNLLPESKKCSECQGMLHLTTNGRFRDVIYRCGAKACRKKKC